MEIIVEMRVKEGEKPINAKRKNKLRRTLRRGVELEGLVPTHIWIGETDG